MSHVARLRAAKPNIDMEAAGYSTSSTSFLVRPILGALKGAGDSVDCAIPLGRCPPMLMPVVRRRPATRSLTALDLVSRSRSKGMCGFEPCRQGGVRIKSPTFLETSAACWTSCVAAVHALKSQAMGGPHESGGFSLE